MKKANLSTTEASALSQLLNVGADVNAWSPDELATMFAHQLAAPLAHDLLEYDPGFSARLSELASASPPQINSFGDLLQHPNPAIELLEKAKQFAKDQGQRGDGPPPEIAAVLYLGCIAAALIRHNLRITDTGQEELIAKLKWATSHDWLDPHTRSLLAQPIGRPIHDILD